MTEQTGSHPQITRYPPTDAVFAATLETSLVSMRARLVSDEGILATLETLLRVSYPLATVRGFPTAAGRLPAWEAFRDEAVRDAEMLTRAGVGDADAFEELYDRHSAYAFGLALRMTNDPPLAEDVVQQAFLSLWRNASSFDPARASVRAWLLSITHNRAVDSLRRRRAPTTRLDTAIEPHLADTGLRAPDVWPEVSARLDQGSVRAALASIPAPQRVVIELAYFRGLTQAEIAAQLGIPLGTVKSRVRLGLAGLRAVLTSGDGHSAPAVNTSTGLAGTHVAASQPH